MTKLLPIVVALALAAVVAPTTAHAQKKKVNCGAYCSKVCATAGSKNYCMSQCLPKCNIATSR